MLTSNLIIAQRLRVWQEHYQIRSNAEMYDGALADGFA